MYALERQERRRLWSFDLKDPEDRDGHTKHVAYEQLADDHGASKAKGKKRKILPRLWHFRKQKTLSAPETNADSSFLVHELLRRKSSPELTPHITSQNHHEFTAKRPFDRLLSQLRNRHERFLKAHVNSNDEVIAEVVVTVLQVKDVKAIQPSLEVSMQGRTERSRPFDALVGLTRPITFRFNITDITCDLYILVLEDYSVRESHQFVGHVIIPIAEYFTLTDPVPRHTETFQLYPLSNPKFFIKYRSGVDKAPNSAMPSSGKNLGFISVSIRIENTTRPAWALYLLSTPCGVPTVADVNVNSAVSVNVMKKNMHRLKRALRMPLIFQTLFTYPYSLLLPFLSIYVFICSEAWQWPIVIAFCILMNGVMVKEARNFDHVILWQDQAGKGTMNPVEKYKSLKNALAQIQHYFGEVATIAEVQSNLWSWADFKVTSLASVLLVVFSLMLSVALRLVPLGWLLCAFSMPMSVLVIAKSAATNKCALLTHAPVPEDAPLNDTKDYDNDAKDNNNSEDDSDGDNNADNNFETTENTSQLSTPTRTPTSVDKVVVSNTNIVSAARMFKNLVARIPDDLEMEHRYIADTARQRGALAAVTSAAPAH